MKQPAYSLVPGWKNCLDLFTPEGHSYRAYCLPQKKPDSCAQESWNLLILVFKGVDGGELCPKQGKNQKIKLL